MRFNGVDGRQEARALQAVAVKLVRRDIRRRNQRNAAREQRFHQAAEQHGVSDIRDKKLVKTQYVRFRFKTFGDDFQRVAMPLKLRQFFMHSQHKAVKVQTLFTFARQAMIEHVHQPGFPPANPAPHI